MPQTVLIVEDTEWSRVALEIALASVRDLSVRAVETAEQAIEFLASNGTCAVITDLDLPGMDGFTLIEIIRAQPRENRLPIVVVSGDTDPETPRRLRALGADAFFSKPYSPAELRRKLEQLIYAD
jgi:CheY-like chemotaxis protein